MIFYIMNITTFKDCNFTQISTNMRVIGYSKYNDVMLTGTNAFYPNVLLQTNNKIISPYDEKIMSLNKSSFYDNNVYTKNEPVENELTDNTVIDCDVFFFIYNFDNYYHFLYDTLPYLHVFLQLKMNNPNIKLLVNYPNEQHLFFYKFNLELLEKIINVETDLIVHMSKNVYKQLFISSSLTHGGFSNEPPCSEIFSVYDIIKHNAIMSSSIVYPKKIYISRRTWLNNDNSNIGTNYTMRRKMMNESELVNKLVSDYGFVEVFAENLTTNDKIALFKNADIVVGSIGGGMANLLFSNKTTKSIVIVSPYFLEINQRFKFCMEHTDIQYFENTKVYTNFDGIPIYCRVKITKDGYYKNKIGEIAEYNVVNNEYLVNVSINNVAGFNENNKYDLVYFKHTDFALLDNGLNSPFVVDLNDFFNKYNNIL